MQPCAAFLKRGLHGEWLRYMVMQQALSHSPPRGSGGMLLQKILDIYMCRLSEGDLRHSDSDLHSSASYIHTNSRTLAMQSNAYSVCVIWKTTLVLLSCVKKHVPYTYTF